MAASARMLPVSDGLLHPRRMGSSIWEYLRMLAHVTAEDPGGNGKPLGIVEHDNPVQQNCRRLMAVARCDPHKP